MRWIIIGLGTITLLLAIVLAREGLWWIAVPDGLFGLGVAWVAWADLHSGRLRPAAFGPQEPAMLPAVELRLAPAAALPAPEPAIVAQQPQAELAASAGAGSHPRRAAKKRGHKHRRH